MPRTGNVDVAVSADDNFEPAEKRGASIEKDWRCKGKMFYGGFNFEACLRLDRVTKGEALDDP